MTNQDERITALEARLEDGWVKIGEATAEGKQVGAWENKWIELLKEYERLSDVAISQRMV